jgi:hypothetical protein
MTMIAELTMPIDVNDYRTFMNDPAGYFDNRAEVAFALSQAEVESLQLQALRARFAHCIETVPMLQRIVDEQTFKGVDTISSIVPILFPHTVYKSYPFAFLEKYQLDRLTAWLDKMTTFDLSALVPLAKEVKSLDAWIDLLKDKTGLTPIFSSGTSGKMSFTPKCKADYRRHVKSCGLGFTAFGDEPGPRKFDLNDVPLVRPGYRYGGREELLNYITELTGLGEEGLYVMYPGRVSADMLLLAGRLRNAEQKGTINSIVLDDNMKARREEFLRVERDAPAATQAFFERVLSDLSGKRVMFWGAWTVLYPAAVEGLKKGINNPFAADSFVMSGGGMKNMPLPPNYKEVVQEFIGAPRIHQNYSMTEVFGWNIMCPHGHYHIVPWVIPYILDPVTGAEMPRTGRQTGRAAFYDLGAEAAWGGIITSDRITLHWWDDPCPCGRHGPYVEQDITRFGAAGEDDKISCAGVPDAHNRALDFFLSQT